MMARYKSPKEFQFHLSAFLNPKSWRLRYEDSKAVKSSHSLLR